MSDKMREEFEAWAVSHARSIQYSLPDEAVQVNGLGDYAIVWVQGAWLGWQASRAAIVVELPFEFCNETMRAESVRNAIHASGVTTK